MRVRREICAEVPPFALHSACTGKATIFIATSCKKFRKGLKTQRSKTAPDCVSMVVSVYSKVISIFEDPNEVLLIGSKEPWCPVIANCEFGPLETSTLLRRLIVWNILDFADLQHYRKKLSIKNSVILILR